MFEEKLKEKYYEACAWIDCLNSMPSTEAKKQHALGYKAALVKSVDARSIGDARMGRAPRRLVWSRGFIILGVRVKMRSRIGQLVLIYLGSK